MKFLALIPARGGSKRLPGKNLRHMCGRSLIQIACEEAKEACSIGEFFISTDSQDIIEEATRFSANAPYLRATEHASDSAPMVVVVQEFVAWLDASEYTADAVVLLQPTSPLRLAKHIDEACELYSSGDFDTVVSVIEVPHQCHPGKVMSLSDRTLRPYLASGPQLGKTGDLDPAFARNGPAVLISSIDDIRQGRLYGDRVGAYQMEPECSVDIDTQTDFDLAEFYMGLRESKSAK